jgi:pimeloyl-ACP methyl ester carboxylesterase
MYISSRPTFLRRWLLGALVIVSAIAGLVPIGTVGAAPSHGEAKPTIVLVHGAFADSSSWNGVITRLEHDGFNVIAPANPLRDLAGDSAYLASILATIDGPIVLAGHSYGGAVITNAAVGNPNVKALVYIAGYALATGESLVAVNTQYPNNQLGTSTIARPFPQADGTTGTDLYIAADKFRDVFAADVRRSMTATMAATQRPLTLRALTDTSAGQAWDSIPSWFMVATDDRAIDPAAERAMAARAGSHTVEVRASHAVLVSRPGAVAALIERASRDVS